MKLKVKLFARARDLVGSDIVELNLPAEAHVSDVRQRLAFEFPRLLPLIPNLLIAINSEYCQEDDLVPENAEVACFPPVSGG